MPNIVVTNVPRPDSALLKRLGTFGVATVHEAQGRTGLLAPYLRPILFWSQKPLESALTVLAHPGDNTMLHVAAEICRPGDVIVVGLSSENSDGMLGELLATSFRARGAMGVIIDAGCRDVAEMSENGVPPFGQKAVLGQREQSKRPWALLMFRWFAPERLSSRETRYWLMTMVSLRSRDRSWKRCCKAAEQREETRKPKFRARLAAGGARTRYLQPASQVGAARLGFTLIMVPTP